MYTIGYLTIWKHFISEYSNNIIKGYTKWIFLYRAIIVIIRFRFNKNTLLIIYF